MSTGPQVNSASKSGLFGQREVSQPLEARIAHLEHLITILTKQGSAQKACEKQSPCKSSQTDMFVCQGGALGVPPSPTTVHACEPWLPKVSEQLGVQDDAINLDLVGGNMYGQQILENNLQGTNSREFVLQGVLGSCTFDPTTNKELVASDHPEQETGLEQFPTVRNVGEPSGVQVPEQDLLKDCTRGSVATVVQGQQVPGGGPLCVVGVPVGTSTVVSDLGDSVSQVGAPVDVTNQIGLVCKNLGEAVSSSNGSQAINDALVNVGSDLLAFSASQGGALSVDERAELEALRGMFGQLNLGAGGMGSVPGATQTGGSAIWLHPTDPNASPYRFENGQFVPVEGAILHQVGMQQQSGQPIVQQGLVQPQQAQPVAVQSRAVAESAGRQPSLVPREVKVEKPLTFSGKHSELQNFIFVMKQYIDTVGLGDGGQACRFLVSFLRDDALTWWRSFSNDSVDVFDQLTLDELIDSLREQFTDIDRELKLRDRVLSLKQTTSVQAYVTAFKKLQLELGDGKLGPEMALHCFVQGLKPYTRQQVHLQRPQDFSEAVILAERCDQSLYWLKGRSSGQQQKVSFKNASQYSNVRTSGPAPMVLGAVQQQQNKKITCYHCGKTGHVKKNCFQLQNQQRSSGGSGPTGRSGDKKKFNPKN